MGRTWLPGSTGKMWPPAKRAPLSVVVKIRILAGLMILFATAFSASMAFHMVRDADTAYRTGDLTGEVWWTRTGAVCEQLGVQSPCLDPSVSLHDMPSWAGGYRD